MVACRDTLCLGFVSVSFHALVLETSKGGWRFLEEFVDPPGTTLGIQILACSNQKFIDGAVVVQVLVSSVFGVHVGVGVEDHQVYLDSGFDAHEVVLLGDQSLVIKEFHVDVVAFRVFGVFGLPHKLVAVNTGIEND